MTTFVCAKKIKKNQKKSRERSVVRLEKSKLSERPVQSYEPSSQYELMVNKEQNINPIFHFQTTFTTKGVKYISLFKYMLPWAKF